jgi:hypothetical protein
MTPIKPMYGRQNVCSRVLEVKGEVLLQTVGTNYYRLACCIRTSDLHQAFAGATKLMQHM